MLCARGSDSQVCLHLKSDRIGLFEVSVEERNCDIRRRLLQTCLEVERQLAQLVDERIGRVAERASRVRLGSGVQSTYSVNQETKPG